MTKRFRIHGEARTEQAVAGMSKVDKSLGKARSAADAMGRSAEKANKKTSDWVRNMSHSVTALRGWAQTGVAVVRTLDQLVMQSLRLQGVQSNMPFAIDKARQAALGMASDFQLSRLAVAAFQGEVAKTPEQFARVISAGTKLGLKLGRDVPDSIERLIMGLAKGEQELLDELGILTKAGEAHQAYADTVGRTVNDLTDADKKQAVLNARLDEAERAAESVEIATDEATEGWIRMKIAMENMANEGVPAVLGGIASMSIGLAELQQNIEIAAQMFAALTGGASAATAVAKEQLQTARGGMQGNLGALAASAQVDAMVKQGVNAEISRVFAMSRAQQAILNNILKKRNREILNPKKGKKTDPHKLIAGMLKGGQKGGETNQEIMEELFGKSQITDPFSDDQIAKVIDFERAKSEVQLNERLRAIDEQRAAGVDPMRLIADEENARAEFLRGEIERADTEAERMRLQDELRATHHQARMMRMATEEKRAQQHAKVMAQVGNSISNVFGMTAEASIRAAFAQEQSVGAAVQAAAKSGAIEMTITAALETIRGLVAIWFNPVEAAAHFTNAGLAAAQAIVLGGIAGSIGAARGGGGGADAAIAGLGGVGSGPAANGPAAPPPLSRPANGDPGASDFGDPGSARRGSGSVVINFHEGSLQSLAPVDRQALGLELRQVIEDSKRSFSGGT